MPATARTLSIRCDESRASRLEAFERATGIMGTTLVSNLLDAALTYYEHGGQITFPMTFAGSRGESPSLAEAPVDYGTMSAKKFFDYAKSLGIDFTAHVTEQPPKGTR